ncbi:hypothetical protein LDENG_00068960 [Lucifuga dentata]|nr:hypothetical protein LDENG_00068960 [Lucifuga dentata]
MRRYWNLADDDRPCTCCQELPGLRVTKMCLICHQECCPLHIQEFRESGQHLLVKVEELAQWTCSAHIKYKMLYCEDEKVIRCPSCCRSHCSSHKLHNIGALWDEMLEQLSHLQEVLKVNCGRFCGQKQTIVDDHKETFDQQQRVRIKQLRHNCCEVRNLLNSTTTCLNRADSISFMKHTSFHRQLIENANLILSRSVPQLGENDNNCDVVMSVIEQKEKEICTIMQQMLNGTLTSRTAESDSSATSSSTQSLPLKGKRTIDDAFPENDPESSTAQDPLTPASKRLRLDDQDQNQDPQTATSSNAVDSLQIGHLLVKVEELDDWTCSIHNQFRLLYCEDEEVIQCPSCCRSHCSSHKLHNVSVIRDEMLEQVSHLQEVLKANCERFCGQQQTILGDYKETFDQQQRAHIKQLSVNCYDVKSLLSTTSMCLGGADTISFVKRTSFHQQLIENANVKLSRSIPQLSDNSHAVMSAIAQKEKEICTIMQQMLNGTLTSRTAESDSSATSSSTQSLPLKGKRAIDDAFPENDPESSTAQDPLTPASKRLRLDDQDQNQDPPTATTSSAVGVFMVGQSWAAAWDPHPQTDETLIPSTSESHISVMSYITSSNLSPSTPMQLDQTHGSSSADSATTTAAVGPSATEPQPSSGASQSSTSGQGS